MRYGDLKERGQKSNIKKFRTQDNLWVIAFSPVYKQYPMYEGSLLTISISQMKSVQTIFHFLNVHFTTHGQDPPKKGQEIQQPWASKFNLGFKVACTWERHKVVGGNVCFFIFVM